MRSVPEFDPDAAAVPGSGLYGLAFTPEQSRFVVVPVPFEATTSYGGGTSRAPAAILRASRQVDLHDRQTGRPFEDGIAMLRIPRRIEALNREAKRLAGPIVRAGGRTGSSRRLKAGLERINDIGARVNVWVGDTTDSLLGSGKCPFVLGGDHSVPFGAIESCARRFPGLGVLHVDAHADLRKAYEGFTWSHASIMHNVYHRVSGVSRIVQVGVRDLGRGEAELIRESGGRIVTFFDSDMASRQALGEPFGRLADEVVSTLPPVVYISFDIDGLDPSLCPHTGTPVPGGLTFHQAILLFEALVRAGKKVVGGDLVEVTPGPRGEEWDANVGARILYKMIGCARLSQGSPKELAGVRDRVPWGDPTREGNDR